jgi:hypothetical protein
MNRLPTDWLTATEAASEFGLPLKQVQKLYQDVVDGKRGKFAIAYYRGADCPMLTVHTLLALTGQLPAPTARHRNSMR